MQLESYEGFVYVYVINTNITIIVIVDPLLAIQLGIAKLNPFIGPSATGAEPFDVQLAPGVFCFWASRHSTLQGCILGGEFAESQGPHRTHRCSVLPFQNPTSTFLPKWPAFLPASWPARTRRRPEPEIPRPLRFDGHDLPTSLAGAEDGCVAWCSSVLEGCGRRVGVW